MSCSTVLIHFIGLHSLLMYLVKINPTLVHKIADKLLSSTHIQLKTTACCSQIMKDKPGYSFVHVLLFILHKSRREYLIRRSFSRKNVAITNLFTRLHFYCSLNVPPRNSIQFLLVCPIDYDRYMICMNSFQIQTIVLFCPE